MNRLLSRAQRSFTKFARHRQQVPLYHYSPRVPDDCFLAPSSTIIGEVILSPRVYVGENVVIRGDMNRITIFDRVSIGENTSISALPSVYKSGETASVVIRGFTFIGPNCTLSSCEIDQFCYIGANTVICEGARIEEGVYVGANSVVPPNRVLPAGTVWSGNPVRFVKNATREERAAQHDLMIREADRVDEENEQKQDRTGAHIWAEEAEEAKKAEKK